MITVNAGRIEFLSQIINKIGRKSLISHIILHMSVFFFFLHKTSGLKFKSRQIFSSFVYLSKSNLQNYIEARS